MRLDLHPAFHECNPSLNCGTFGEAIWGILDDKPVTFAVGGSQYTHLMIRVDGHVGEEEFRAARRYTAAVVNRGPQHYFPVVFATERLIYPISTGDDASATVAAVFGELPGLDANEIITFVDIVDALQQPR